MGLVDVDNRGLAGIEKFIDDNPQLAMAGAGVEGGEGVSLSIGLYTEFKRALRALEKTLLDNHLVTPEELEDTAIAEADKE